MNKRCRPTRMQAFEMRASPSCVRGLLLVLSVVSITQVSDGVPSARPPASHGALRLLSLDVGQGDATLLTTPEGRHVLVDGGPEQYAVANTLRRLGIDTIDIIIASHNHADHIGGLSAVFDAFPVRAYIENGVPHPTAAYRHLLERVEREPGLRVLTATDRRITLGSVTLRILPPPNVHDSQNNNSVGVLAEYGRFRALFTGDAETAELHQWLRDGRVPTVTMLRAAHHGSRNGVSAAWIRAVQPTVVVISVGTPNRYGHPSARVVSQWRNASASVYRTDRDGSIDVEARRDGSFTLRTSADARVLRGATR